MASETADVFNKGTLDAIKVSRQFIILLEDYRYLLACYQESCGCHVNFDYQVFFRKLEEKYSMLSNISSKNSLLSDALNDNSDYETINELYNDVQNKKTSNKKINQNKTMISRVKISGRSNVRNNNIETETLDCEMNDVSYEVPADTAMKGEKTAYKCTHPKCEFLSFNQEDVNNHINNHECGDIPRKVADKKDVLYVCDKCSKEFTSQKWLQNHVDNVHSVLKMYVCDFPSCSYQTRFRCVIDDHKKRHVKTKEFKCDWENCESQFVTKRDMLAHINFIHKGIKNHFCNWPECGASFKDSNRLRHHYFIHTGERPYRCDFSGCAASFKQLPHLNKHKLTHSTGCKRFECEYPDCGHTFRLEGDLKKHISSVHIQSNSINLYTKCEVEDCYKYFKSKEQHDHHLKEDHDLMYYPST